MDGTMRYKYSSITNGVALDSLAYAVDVSFNVKFFAMNLFLTVFDKSWKCTPTEKQTAILQFLESYFRNDVAVHHCVENDIVERFQWQYPASEEVCPNVRNRHDG